MKMKKKIILNLMLVLLLTGACSSFDLSVDQGAKLSIIPEPLSIELGDGFFELSDMTGIESSDEFTSVANFIQEDIKQATSFSLSGNENKIVITYDSAYGAKAEGYSLIVSENEIAIVAKTEAGAFYAYQTLKQMMPAYVYGANGAKNETIQIPSAIIEDEPQFQWRGLLLDVGRNFMTVEEVKRYIDLMAMHKFNIFHWHLTDDQGWRLEIKAFPNLTKVGAWRSETVKGHPMHNLGNDGKPHGGFYTQEDAREIVAYAAKRHITVVPEIDMPGHAQAAIASYPELGNYPETQLDLFKTIGVSPNIYNPSNNTINFLKTVLDEVMEIFPSKYIHIGGDEAFKSQWVKSDVAKVQMKKHGLKSVYELQSWFVTEIGTYLESKGRKFIGWDEIMQGGIKNNATVMSWQGELPGSLAASKKHEVIMTPRPFTYIDYRQATFSKEPVSLIGLGQCTLEMAYDWSPIPEFLNPKYHQYILGGQGNLWTDFVKDFDHVLYMAYPRAAAIAESTWSLKEKKNFGKFTYKLKKHYARLTAADIPFRYPDDSNRYILKFNADLSGVAELTLEPDASGFYQLFINEPMMGEIETFKVELLVDGEVVDVHERAGVVHSKFAQSSIYTVNTKMGDIAKQSTVTAKIYYKLVSKRATAIPVIVKSLDESMNF